MTHTMTVTVDAAQYEDHDDGDVSPAPILRLARITHADAGRCSCCDAPGIAWYRTGIIADGRILVAARYCADHDVDTHPGAAQYLGDLTIADVARLSPRRARRAAAKIASVTEAGHAFGQASASLAGASSATHTYALLDGVCREQADTLRALAAAYTAARHLALTVPWTYETRDALARELVREYHSMHGEIGGNDLRVIIDCMIANRGPKGARPTVSEIHDVVVEAREEHVAERAHEIAQSQKGVGFWFDK